MKPDAAGGELDAAAALEPTAEEVAARKRELQQLACIERARLESFFDFCCFDHSFVDLRRRIRQDLEVCGNAFREVLRDARGEVARLVYVPSFTVRLLPLDRSPTEVEDRIRVSPVSLDTATVRHRLRRYVQIQGTDRVFFKSFGDPRIVLPGEFPETDLAKVFCVRTGAAKLLQTLLPGPGVQPDTPRVAAGQGTIVVSTSPYGPVLGVLAVYAPSSVGGHIEASLAPPCVGHGCRWVRSLARDRRLEHSSQRCPKQHPGTRSADHVLQPAPTPGTDSASRAARRSSP